MWLLVRFSTSALTSLTLIARVAAVCPHESSIFTIGAKGRTEHVGTKYGVQHPVSSGSSDFKAPHLRIQ